MFSYSKTKNPQDENSAGFLIDFNLIQVKLHPAMIPFQKVDFVYSIFFVVVENLYVLIFQQIQIDLVAVVANAHDLSLIHI